MFWLTKNTHWTCPRLLDFLGLLIKCLGILWDFLGLLAKCFEGGGANRRLRETRTIFWDNFWIIFGIILGIIFSALLAKCFEGGGAKRRLRVTVWDCCGIFLRLL